MRAARTPPEPPPITNRSTSNSAISSSTCSVVDQLDLLAALAHLGAELRGHGVGEIRGPLVHGGHAHLDRLGLGRKQLLADRRLVEGDEIRDLLIGKLVAVDLR